MREKILTVLNSSGLHARPAATLVQKLRQYACDVKIVKDDFEINARSIMGIMALAAACGSKLKFVADGTDEEELLSAVEKLFYDKFGEPNE
ncbi:MAG: HPr family phosphocarrier protein [Elusimicrobiota bacterium]|jgi:phosphocarrier protein|nr:HPr family phosphocarrier protein [Elusimicrobiota bacterium]